MKRTMALAVLCALVLGCGSKEEPKAAPNPARPSDPNVVLADAPLLERLKIAPVKREPVRATLRIPGSVEIDPRRVARIGSNVTGRITEVRAFIGDTVNAGQTLATLNSTELAQAQMTFLKAIAEVDFKTRAVERAKQLLAADVIGSAELQRRENELFEAQVSLNASRDQLRILGMSPGAIGNVTKSREISSAAQVVSTMAGIVVERKVNQGQVVQPADALYTIADLSHLLVQGGVPEQQTHMVGLGEEVRIEVPALPGREITGKIIWINDVVHPETRTVQVRTEVRNQNRTIKPDMLATLLIQGAPREQLVVPAPAVVREGNRDFVFLRLSENEFKLVPVQLGPQSGTVVVVHDGIKEGDLIVADGAFHLNSERKRKNLG